MLRFGLSLLFGLLFIYSGSSLPAAGSLLLVFLVVLVMAIPGRSHALPVLAGFALGLGLGWSVAAERLADRLDPALAGTVIETKGRIASLVDEDADRQRFLFEPVDERLPARIRLTVYSLEPEFRAGERWQLAVKLREPRGFANPAGFDIERWYFREGIGATGYVRRHPAPLRLSAAEGWLGWREGILAAIRQRTAGFRNAGLLRALAAGDRRYLEDADWALLRETGTSHLVAISGLHLALLAMISGVLLRRTLPAGLVSRPWGRLASLLLLEIIISAYALLAGLDTPVQRAWVMISLGLLALAIARRFRWSAIYGLALSIVLLIDPLAPLDVGFWLSFGAVAAVLFSVGGRIRHRAGWRAAISTQWQLSLLLMPLTLASFSLLAPAGFITNLVAIPLTGFLLLPLLLLALSSWPFEMVSRALFRLADHGFELLEWFLSQVVASLPSLGIVLPAPALLLLAGGLLFALLPRPFGVRATGCVLLAMSALLQVVTPPNDLRHGEWRMTALDVGQGTSVLLETRSHVAVYDTGPGFHSGSAAESVVIPMVRHRGLPPGILVVSHEDSDHAGGLTALQAAFPAAVTLSGRNCTAGHTWEWDGVFFRVLHPQAGAEWSDNNGSCVIQVNGRHSALLTGDIEAPAEASLLRQGLQPVDVLLAPHHGSSTSSTRPFVAATSPGIVIFPAGFANRWGFPREDVLQRWRTTGASLLVIGEEGALTVTSTHHGLQTERWRAGNPQLWRYPAPANRYGAGRSPPPAVR